ncbi:MAG: response regulator receiver protein [Candidatus Eremiobacteraeota bacterium]|jgi:FixJ family two-component response regulator|nr:response regulator receiver protein [Candidatus Eremiobacteraeota bacterium]
MVSTVVNIQSKSELIAVVDDDESVRSAVHGVLKSVGLKTRAFASAEEFLRSGHRSETACLITDIQMPGMSGLELQATLAEEEPRIPIIFITAYGDVKTRTQAMRGGAVEFLVKPFDDDVLLESVRAVLEG